MAVTNKRLLLILYAAVMLFSSMLFCNYTPKAEENNDYEIIIDDKADLISSYEEEELRRTMEAITEYGGAAFVTNPEENTYSGDANSFARELYREYFDTSSGVLFLIDMYNRRIEIFSDGTIYKKITIDVANTITTNIYEEATYGNYFDCADSAFKQIHYVLAGGRVHTGVKGVTNLLFSFAVALMINFLVVYIQRNAAAPREVKSGITANTRDKYKVVKNVKTKMIKRIKSTNSSSSGGGSFGGGGSSGGGGGSSGGGGGHSF